MQGKITVYMNSDDKKLYNYVKDFLINSVEVITNVADVEVIIHDGLDEEKM